jgi:hypothetical protein
MCYRIFIRGIAIYSDQGSVEELLIFMNTSEDGRIKRHWNILMTLPIMNSRFLPKILVVIFIGNGTAYSTNLNFWKFASPFSV